MLKRLKMSCVPIKLDSQTEVCNTAGSILFNQDVFALQVSVCNSWFALCAVDLSVEMTKA